VKSDPSLPASGGAAARTASRNPSGRLSKRAGPFFSGRARKATAASRRPPFLFSSGRTISSFTRDSSAGCGAGSLAEPE
jgi:hypothetical protein